MSPFYFKWRCFSGGKNPGLVNAYVDNSFNTNRTHIETAIFGSRPSAFPQVSFSLIKRGQCPSILGRVLRSHHTGHRSEALSTQEEGEIHFPSGVAAAIRAPDCWGQGCRKGPCTFTSSGPLSL